MSFPLRLHASLLAGLAAIATPSAAAAAGQGSPSVPRGYVVVYEGNRIGMQSRARAPAARKAVARTTGRLERTYGFVSRRRYSYALGGFAARLTAKQATELRRDPRVALVEPDRIFRADARVPLASGETVPAGVSRIEAVNEAGAHGPSSVAVAVIDTGIDLSNKQLNVAPGLNCTGRGQPNDDNGHGTEVAGVIGARNDGEGLVGVAPGTKLYSVKALGANAAGLLSQVICGVEWVSAHASALNIRVATLSLAGEGPYGDCSTEALHLAICNSAAAGVTYVVAAGNEGRDFASSPVQIPAAYPEVLTVTAMSDSDGRPGGVGPVTACGLSEPDDHAASFSNFASTPIDADHVLAAPGVCVSSTARIGGEATDSGTSFAVPHVAGVVALCMGESAVPGPCTEMSSSEVIQQVRADAAANATPENGFIGDPGHALGGYFGYLVSARDPSVRRLPFHTASTAPPSPAQPAPNDTKVDLLDLRVSKVQDVDRLRVTVGLGEPGAVSARATVRLGPASASTLVRSRRAARSVEPNRRVTLRLKFSHTRLRRIKRTLRQTRRLRARITIAAQDQRGNSLTKRRGVRLRP